MRRLVAAPCGPGRPQAVDSGASRSLADSWGSPVCPQGRPRDSPAVPGRSPGDPQGVLGMDPLGSPGRAQRLPEVGTFSAQLHACSDICVHVQGTVVVSISTAETDNPVTAPWGPGRPQAVHKRSKVPLAGLQDQP